MSLQIYKSHKGFTLVEILIVIALMALIATFGYYSYTQFNNGQALASSYNDLSGFLREAKSDTLSQAKPSSCTADAVSRTLVGFRIIVKNASIPNYYVLDAICANSSGVQIAREMKRITLPKNITLSISTPSSKTFYSFLIPTASASESATLTLSDGTNSKILNVDTQGLVVEGVITP